MLWSATSVYRTLLWVSIDDFRGDHFDWPLVRHMNAIAAQGTRVTQLLKVYSARTFSGHLSLVSGLHPPGHTIVENYF